MSNGDANEPPRLRVALDTSFLHLPPSGIGTYVRCLRQAMPSAAPDIDLVTLEPTWSAVDARPGGLKARLAADPRVRRFLWDVNGVATVARRESPAVLHVPQMAAPLRSSAPLVVTIHDAIPYLLSDYQRSPAMRINLAVMRRTVRRARRVIAPSQSAADDIVRVLRFPKSKIAVVPLAAAPELTPGDPSAARTLVADRFGVRGDYIFNIAGFDRRKNLPVLIEAYARTQSRLDRAVSLVIGGAPHADNPRIFPEVRPLIHTLGIEDKVIFTGKVTDEERLRLYQGASAYATPSLYEGFGLTALEAMACGVPTIVADRTSLPEVVSDAGLVVPPTTESFAEALVATLTDAELQSRLRAAGIERAGMFSWERTAGETAAIYREVALARPQPSF